MRAKTLFLTSGKKSARMPVIEWVPGHLQPPTRPGDGSQAPARFLLPADQTGAAAAAGGQAGQPACRPREAARAAAAVAAAEGEAAPAAEAEAAAAAAAAAAAVTHCQAVRLGGICLNCRRPL